MRILVTGGAGFLGSHLCERLLGESHQVICLDNFTTGSRKNIEHLYCPDFKVIEADVVRPARFNVERIFHMACPASPAHYQRDRVGTILTAVEGTLNMLRLAQAVDARLLVASTSEVYGEPDQHPQPETYWGKVNPVGDRACYDEGKRCGEALASSYVHEYGVDVRVVRIFNTYGPRMDERDGRVVSNFVSQALRGQPLTVYGDGSQTRSFCYVDDMIDGLVGMMNLWNDPGPVNLGNPEELSVRSLAELVVAISGSESTISEGPLPADDPTRRRPDIGKAQMLLGWRPAVAIRAGLQRTINDFGRRLDLASRPPRSDAIAS